MSAAAHCGEASWCDIMWCDALWRSRVQQCHSREQFNISSHYGFTCKRWWEKKVVLFSLEMTALAGVTLNQIDDPFFLPRGHSNVRAWDPPRLQRDRWDLVCYDLAELIFLPGLVCCLVIKGVVAINTGRIRQRHCLLGRSSIQVKKISHPQSNKAKRDCLADAECHAMLCICSMHS